MVYLKAISRFAIALIAYELLKMRRFLLMRRIRLKGTLPTCLDLDTSLADKGHMKSERDRCRLIRSRMTPCVENGRILLMPALNCAVQKQHADSVQIPTHIPFTLWYHRPVYARRAGGRSAQYGRHTRGRLATPTR